MFKGVESQLTNANVVPKTSKITDCSVSFRVAHSSRCLFRSIFFQQLCHFSNIPLSLLQIFFLAVGSRCKINGSFAFRNHNIKLSEWSRIKRVSCPFCAEYLCKASGKVH